PKVDSAVVRFVRRTAPPVDVPSPGALFALARAGFAQRRKTLRQALRAAPGIPPLTRAEALTLDQWAGLARAAGASGPAAPGGGGDGGAGGGPGTCGCWPGPS